MPSSCPNYETVLWLIVRGVGGGVHQSRVAFFSKRGATSQKERKAMKREREPWNR